MKAYKLKILNSNIEKKSKILYHPLDQFLTTNIRYSIKKHIDYIGK